MRKAVRSIYSTTAIQFANWRKWLPRFALVMSFGGNAETQRPQNPESAFLRLALLLLRIDRLSSSIQRHDHVRKNEV